MMLTKDELIKLVHKALADSNDKDVDCERLTSFEQDNDEGSFKVLWIGGRR